MKKNPTPDTDNYIAVYIPVYLHNISLCEYIYNDQISSSIHINVKTVKIILKKF